MTWTAEKESLLKALINEKEEHTLASRKPLIALIDDVFYTGMNSADLARTMFENATAFHVALETYLKGKVS